MKRIDILKNSLDKKEKKLNERINDLYSDVRRGNGQPMNDKRNGASTMKRWDSKEEGIYNQIDSINRTKEAIERERNKICHVESISEDLPNAIINFINEGKIIQWRKFPNRFFVPNGGKARLIWNLKTKKLQYNLKGCTKEEYKIFREIANELIRALN
jgi:hypothetical protein